jgi:hypothetical protein
VKRASFSHHGECNLQPCGMMWICTETITLKSCLAVLFSCCKYPCMRNNTADSKEMRFKSDLHLYFHRVIMEHSSSHEKAEGGGGRYVSSCINQYPVLTPRFPCLSHMIFADCINTSLNNAWGSDAMINTNRRDVIILHVKQHGETSCHIETSLFSMI